MIAAVPKDVDAIGGMLSRIAEFPDRGSVVLPGKAGGTPGPGSHGSPMASRVDRSYVPTQRRETSVRPSTFGRDSIADSPRAPLKLMYTDGPHAHEAPVRRSSPHRVRSLRCHVLLGRDLGPCTTGVSRHSIQCFVAGVVDVSQLGVSRYRVPVGNAP